MIEIAVKIVTVSKHWDENWNLKLNDVCGNKCALIERASKKYTNDIIHWSLWVSLRVGDYMMHDML